MASLALFKGNKIHLPLKFTHKQVVSRFLNLYKNVTMWFYASHVLGYFMAGRSGFLN